MKRMPFAMLASAFLLAVLLSGCVDTGPICGVSGCEIGETPETCPQDCPPAEFCGDESCDLPSGETWETCPADCPLVESDLECVGNHCIGASNAQPTDCTTDACCACCAADSTGDSVVDVFDLAAVANNYERTDCSPANNWCDGADINQDGRVDAIDLGLLGSYYNVSCPSPCHPFPATVTRTVEKDIGAGMTIARLSIVSSESAIAIQEFFSAPDCTVLDYSLDNGIDIFEFNETENTWVLADRQGISGIEMRYYLPINCDVVEGSGTVSVLDGSGNLRSSPIS